MSDHSTLARLADDGWPPYCPEGCEVGPFVSANTGYTLNHTGHPSPAHVRRWNQSAAEANYLRHEVRRDQRAARQAPPAFRLVYADQRQHAHGWLSHTGTAYGPAFQGAHAAAEDIYNRNGGSDLEAAYLATRRAMRAAFAPDPLATVEAAAEDGAFACTIDETAY